MTETIDSRLAVIIMAAGKGTRMRDPRQAKVMYTVKGRPMLDYVLDVALLLHPARTLVVVGWQKHAVERHLSITHRPVELVEQSPQLGTGHAVMQAETALREFAGDVLVLSGDVPLLTLPTIQSLLGVHRSKKAAATVLTAEVENPSGYGRVIRDQNGRVQWIKEDKDATPEQRRIREINSGIYVFHRGHLFSGLKHISPANTQKEHYLTEVFDYFWKNRLPVEAVRAAHAQEVQGVNTPEDLKHAATLLTPAS